MYRKTVRVIGVLAVLAAVFMPMAVSPVLADPHTGQSVNVVIIGGSVLSTDGSSYSAANVMGYSGGGFLPVTGSAGELGDFVFTAMLPASVSAASLSAFDTAVLNVASEGMACNSNTLTAQQQADLVAFVALGKKLIIYDSECWTAVDYSWLPFPFTTANPGALGEPGVLTIVENDTLASNVASDVHFIDAAYLGPNTDAVGDMNVLTTYDVNWCLSMSGTNADGVTGAVHTYAKYPSGADAGLIIYNGLDQDYQWSADPWLRKIWVQELQQPFNPSNLPCGYTVVPSFVPEASTLLLLASGLTGVAGYVGLQIRARRRK